MRDFLWTQICQISVQPTSPNFFFGWKHIKWTFIWCIVITFLKNTVLSSEWLVPEVKPIKNGVQKLWKKLSNSIKLQAGTTFKPISSAKLIRIFKNCSPLSPTLTSGPPLKIAQNRSFYCIFTHYLTNFGDIRPIND